MHRLALATFNGIDQGIHRTISDFKVRLRNSGYLWLAHCGFNRPVKTNDGDIVWDFAFRSAKGIHAPQCHQVVGAEYRRDVGMGRKKRTGCIDTALICLVGLENKGGISSDTCCFQSRSIASLTRLARVGRTLAQ